MAVIGEAIAELEAPDLSLVERLGGLDQGVAGLRELGDAGRVEEVGVVEDAEGGAQRANA